MILVRPLPIALNDRPELDQDAVGAAPMTQPSTTTESQRPRGPDARAPVWPRFAASDGLRGN
jgi:hypothetical protein